MKIICFPPLAQVTFQLLSVALLRARRHRILSAQETPHEPADVALYPVFLVLSRGLLQVISHLDRVVGVEIRQDLGIDFLFQSNLVEVESEKLSENLLVPERFLILRPGDIEGGLLGVGVEIWVLLGLLA